MLSDINLETLIKEKTNNYLNSNAQYAILRHHCLDMLPIPAVVLQCINQLEQAAATEKKSTAADLIKNALSGQTQQDLDESKEDSQQEQHDLSLKKQLEAEKISNQEQTKKFMAMRHGTKEQIRKLELQIQHVEQAIANYERPQNNTHTHNEGNTHAHHDDNTHTHNEGNTHTHHDDNTHTHNEGNTHTHEDANSSIKKQKLIAQKQKLFVELQAAKTSLIAMESDILRLNARYHEITDVLYQELPEKELKRINRFAQRTKREQAQQQSDDIKQKLSTSRHQALMQSIINADQQTEKQKKAMLDMVSKQSYEKFISSLKSMLACSPKLAPKEVSALKQIIEHLNTYHQALQKKAEKTGQLHKSQINDVLLSKQLHEANKEIERIKKSNPSLDKENASCEKQNTQLKQTIAQRHRRNNKILIASVFSMLTAGGLVGAAFLAMKFMTISATMMPLLFIPASIAALVTLGLWTASTIYAVQNKLDGSKISENAKTIVGNMQKMSAQVEKIKKLEQTVIPGLQIQLKGTKQQIEQFKQEIKAEEEKAEKALQRAKQVTLDARTHQHGAMFDSASKKHTHKDTAKGQPSAGCCI